MGELAVALKSHESIEFADKSAGTTRRSCLCVSGGSSSSKEASGSEAASGRTGNIFLLNMVLIRYDFFFAALKKGVCRSSSAVGLYYVLDLIPRRDKTAYRLAGSLTKQLSTISLKAREYL